MNKIILAGKVYTQPEFSHEYKGKKFYKFFLESVRTSGHPDILPCVAEEKILCAAKENDMVKLVGEIRTRNVIREAGMKLEIKVYVKELFDYEGMDENDATLEGYICKNGFVRKTPRGRKIVDVIMASHRGSNIRSSSSDYIPCIFWGNDADEISKYPLGELIPVSGRLQSRDYKKRLPDGSVENRVAYEFSVASIDMEEV